MKINYEQIIEKANERKLALEELTVALKEARARQAELASLAKWVSNLKGIYRRLDQEGRTMLPKEINNALLNMGGTYDLLVKVNESPYAGISHLLTGSDE